MSPDRKPHSFADVLDGTVDPAVLAHLEAGHPIYCPECGISAPRDVVSANIAELIAFGTHKLTTAPGRGPIDVEGATPRSRESATGTGDKPVRAPAETSTSRDLRSNENNVGGFGLRRKARPVPIDPVSLEREPKPHGHKKLRKHPASAG